MPSCGTFSRCPTSARSSIFLRKSCANMNLTYVSGACSNGNQYETWANLNAALNANLGNLYYIALFYAAPAMPRSISKPRIALSFARRSP